MAQSRYRAVLLGIAMLCFAGCTKISDNATGAGRHTWTQPGILRVAIQQDVKSLNPLLAATTTDNFVAKLLFEPLLSADDRGNPVPILATEVPTTENGGISTDGLTITYHLRPARWTDGQPVTSRDVKWTWQAIMNTANNVISRHVYDDVTGIDTPNDRTAVVHLARKFAPFVNSFFAESDSPQVVLPAHVLSKYASINQVPFNDAPSVSDGPFQFMQWNKGDRITVAANPNFFLGPPRLKRITIREVPDENTTVNLLRTHDIDWIFEASIHNYREVSTIPDTRIVWVNVNGYEALGLNVGRPLLRDLRVRQAIALSIDKQQLIDTLTYSQNTMATEDLPNWLWAFNPHVAQVAADTNKARTLLAQAGWSRGADGIMHKGATRLSLELVSNNSNTTRRQAAVEIQKMLHDAGIDAEIKFFPGQQLFAPAGMGGILQLGDYDLTLSGWFAGIDPDNSTTLLCKYFPPHGWNNGRYCNPELDRQEAIALENYDRPTRTAAYYKIQELEAHDVPSIFLWWARQMQPVSVDFKGFDPNPVTESWNAWQWNI